MSGFAHLTGALASAAVKRPFLDLRNTNERGVTFSDFTCSS